MLRRIVFLQLWKEWEEDREWTREKKIGPMEFGEAMLQVAHFVLRETSKGERDIRTHVNVIIGFWKLIWFSLAYCDLCNEL